MRNILSQGILKKLSAASAFYRDVFLVRFLNVWFVEKIDGHAMVWKLWGLEVIPTLL